MRKRNAFAQITKLLLMSVLTVFLMTGCGIKESGEAEKAIEPQGITNQQGAGQQKNAVQGEETDKQDIAEQSNESNQQETDESSEVSKQQETDVQSEATEQPINSETASDGDVDVDLTQLSSTVVFSEVYNMTTIPENYIGKMIKMNGIFSVYEDEETGKIYFSCIIADATACCSQGIEFVLSGEHVYPDDYPEEGSEIVVQGIFETYEENGYTYCQLKDAVME